VSFFTTERIVRNDSFQWKGLRALMKATMTLYDNRETMPYCSIQAQRHALMRSIDSRHLRLHRNYPSQNFLNPQFFRILPPRIGDSFKIAVTAKYTNLQYIQAWSQYLYRTPHQSVLHRFSTNNILKCLSRQHHTQTSWQT